jgi:ethanolamine ammonia-lyase small subunit
MARDAVHEPLAAGLLASQLQDQAFEPVAMVQSAAPDRDTYLRRPDLGRRLAPGSAASLEPLTAPGALVVVIGDGLSARAAQAHALPLLVELRPRLEAAGMAIGPVVIARQARVALGDEVGTLLGAGVVLVLIGERPGLSSPDSLGAYLTWAPRVGCVDSQRNCVSNIRPQGLPPAAAAHRIAWLLAAARRLGASGVALKDDSDAPAALPGQSSP